MIYERFEVKGVAHYSYLVGCAGAGVAAIIDPRRDIDIYLEAAKSHGLKIAWVLETHIHADYASGARELAEVTGAEALLSAYDEGELYDVSFSHTPMSDGQELQVGAVRLQALHTPGHTPEHLSFLCFDEKRSKTTPLLMFSGDFLFVGSLGRPDLLGEDAKVALARRLFHSVREKLKGLPDGLEIHPAHGAGSMCGAGLSARPNSTLGYEKATNPFLDPSLTEAAFVEKILGTVPPFPPYYRLMKDLNAQGAPSVLGNWPPPKLTAAEALAKVQEGCLVLDVRASESYAAGHIPRSLWAGCGPGLPTWAAWVLPYKRPFILVVEGPRQAEEACRWLFRVGLDAAVGYLEGLETWKSAGGRLKQTKELTAASLFKKLDSGEALTVVDVRGDGEWAGGHIPQALHIMGGFLAERVGELPQGPVATLCASGYRSCVAASVLEYKGRDEVCHVVDGYQAWRRAGYPSTS